MKKNNIILVTGGSGRFGEHLKKIKSSHRLFFPNKKDAKYISKNIVKVNALITNSLKLSEKVFSNEPITPLL